MMGVSEKLDAIRNAFRIGSEDGLADKFGVDRTSVWRWRNGYAKPPARTMRLINSMWREAESKADADQRSPDDLRREATAAIALLRGDKLRQVADFLVRMATVQRATGEHSARVLREFDRMGLIGSGEVVDRPDPSEPVREGLKAAERKQTRRRSRPDNAAG